jgi:hypothetical protein
MRRATGLYSSLAGTGARALTICAPDDAPVGGENALGERRAIVRAYVWSGSGAERCARADTGRTEGGGGVDLVAEAGEEDFAVITERDLLPARQARCEHIVGDAVGGAHIWPSWSSDASRTAMVCVDAILRGCVEGAWVGRMGLVRNRAGAMEAR